MLRGPKGLIISFSLPAQDILWFCDLAVLSPLSSFSLRERLIKKKRDHGHCLVLLHPPGRFLSNQLEFPVLELEHPSHPVSVTGALPAAGFPAALRLLRASSFAPNPSVQEHLWPWGATCGAA